MSRISASRGITSRSVPWRLGSSVTERGNNSYQLAKRASRRSASTKVGGLCVTCGRVPARCIGIDGFRRDQKRDPAGIAQLVQRFQYGVQRLRRCAARLRPRRGDQGPAFGNLQRQGQSGIALLDEVVDEAAIVIDPGFDSEAVPAHAYQREMRNPAVVVERMHAHAGPAALVLGAVQKLGRQQRMTVGKDVGFDPHTFADNALDGELFIDMGRDRLDGDARRLGRGQTGLVSCGGMRGDRAPARRLAEPDFAGAEPVGRTRKSGDGVQLAEIAQRGQRVERDLRGQRGIGIDERSLCASAPDADRCRRPATES